MLLQAVGNLAWAGVIVGFIGLGVPAGSQQPITGTGAADEAVPSYGVGNAATRMHEFDEAISRGVTIRNHALRATVFVEAISRSLTVWNRIGSFYVFDEAISRGYTVLNHALRLHEFDEAISRSYTVRNDAVRGHVFDEAISRSYTVRNTLTRRHEFTEAISRSYTVVNHPQLTLRLEAGGGECAIQARCGATIPFQIIGELSDGNNDGLGMFGLTLAFDGGAIPHVEQPSGDPSCENPMANFVQPLGFTEPNGFGGTLVNGKLVHVGGGQNTFNNMVDWPVGEVIPGVAQASGCGPAALVTGSVTAPSTPGTYTLRVENTFATAIKKGASGEVYWPVRPAVVTASNELTIEVIGTRCQGTDQFVFSLFHDCFAGPGNTPSPPLAFLTSCDCLGLFDDDRDGDVDFADFASIQGDWVPTDCVQRILSSDPPICAIDARQPTDATFCFEPFGFDSITLNMACGAGGLTASDFRLSTNPSGAAPTIVGVSGSQRAVTLSFNAPIPEGRWTCVTHTASGTRACIGALPGDVNNNGTVGVDDATVPSFGNLPLYQCDIDHDGVCTEADLDRLDDLFFGNGCFDFWLGRTLPQCP
jgi:hypothetical protein